MGESFVKTLIDDTLIIDIASYPFGIDESLVKKYNLKYFRESGIPGRYAPKSAGEIMAKTIIDYIN
jgi:dipicolinate synthase subunit A